MLASVFMSVCCLHTPSWVSRSCPLSNHPGGEDVTTVLRDHIFRVQLLLCRGYAGSELTVQQRSPRDCRRWIIAVSPHVLAHYFGIYVAPACWSNLTVPKTSLLSAMTPFQALCGCSSSTALDVLRPQADFTEKENSNGGKSTSSRQRSTTPASQTRSIPILGRIMLGDERQEGGKFRMEVFLRRTWRAGKSFS